MPEDDPEVFAIYAQLLYRPDLLTVKINLADTELEHEFIALAKLYAFAEKVMDATTKNTLLKTFNTLTANRLLPVEAAQIIYYGTPEDDPASRHVRTIVLAQRRRTLARQYPRYWTSRPLSGSRFLLKQALHEGTGRGRGR